MSDFKVDQISFVYFFPGMLVILGAIGILSDIPVAHSIALRLSGLDGAITIAIFAAVSYPVGYACWIVADQWRWPIEDVRRLLKNLVSGAKRLFLGRSQPPPESDEVRPEWNICGGIDHEAWLLVFRYICQEKLIREMYLRMLRARANHDLENAVKLVIAAHIFVDPLAKESPTTCNACRCFLKSPRNQGCETHGMTPLFLEMNGRRIWFLIWNWAYNLNNQYHIGRMISSWNNFKFLKASTTACAIPLLLLGSRCIASVLSDEITIKSPLAWTTGLIVFALWIVFNRYGIPWRRRVWARDLVYSLAP